MEEWRDVSGFEGFYEVNNFGRVRHKDGQEIGGSINSYGYRAYSLFRDGKRHTAKGHRLVAEAFIPNPDAKRNVNHKDGNRDNNSVENLEWATHSENGKHARKELCIDYSEKSVAQYTSSGELVAIWVNATIAARLLSISSQLISACCRGTAKSAGDFIWRFTGPASDRWIKCAQAAAIREKLSTLSQQLSTLESEIE